MKRFRSRMDSLTRLRQQTELLAKMRSAARQKEVSDADAVVETLRHSLSNHHQESRTCYESDLSGSMLEVLLARESRDRSRILDAMNQQHAAQLRLHSAIAEHSQARSELKIVNQVTDREQQAHRRQQLLAEEHAQYEAAAQAFHSKQAAHQQSSGTAEGRQETVR